MCVQCARVYIILLLNMIFRRFDGDLISPRYIGADRRTDQTYRRTRIQYCTCSPYAVAYHHAESDLIFYHNIVSTGAPGSSVFRAPDNTALRGDHVQVWCTALVPRPSCCWPSRCYSIVQSCRTRLFRRHRRWRWRQERAEADITITAAGPGWWSPISPPRPTMTRTPKTMTTITTTTRTTTRIITSGRRRRRRHRRLLQPKTMTTAAVRFIIKLFARDLRGPIQFEPGFFVFLILVRGARVQLN